MAIDENATSEKVMLKLPFLITNGDGTIFREIFQFFNQLKCRQSDKYVYFNFQSYKKVI